MKVNITIQTSDSYGNYWVGDKYGTQHTKLNTFSFHAGKVPYNTTKNDIEIPLFYVKTEK